MRVLVVSDVRFFREGLSEVLPRRSRMAVVATAEAGDQAVALSLALNPDIILFDTGLAGGLAIVASLVDAVPAIPIIALAVAETEHAILTWAEAGVTGYVHRSASIIELIDTAMLAARGEQKCSTKVAGAMLRRLHQLAATATRVGHSTTQTTEARLTPREREVAQLVAAGLGNRLIAQQLEVATCETSHTQHARTQRPDALRQERYSKTEARLTPREREVAQLVADGLSNKLIAQRLNMEVATVKCHMHHILDKLKFHQRSSLALWVLQHDPDLDSRDGRVTPRA